MSIVLPKFLRFHECGLACLIAAGFQLFFDFFYFREEGLFVKTINSAALTVIRKELAQLQSIHGDNARPFDEISAS